MAETLRRRVLVVDDNRDATETLSMLLQTKGHETRVAATGEEALAAAADFEPDVILLDLGLPGMDGFEIAQRLRETPRGPSFTIVALTGWGGKEIRDKAAAAGFDYHLLKPIQWDELDRLFVTPRAACK